MAGASGHSTVYRRSRVTAARKLRFVEQPRLHAGQPDRRLAFNIDAHEPLALAPRAGLVTM
jgi:hypothetical protein